MVSYQAVEVPPCDVTQCQYEYCLRGEEMSSNQGTNESGFSDACLGKESDFFEPIPAEASCYNVEAVLSSLVKISILRFILAWQQ